MQKLACKTITLRQTILLSIILTVLLNALAILLLVENQTTSAIFKVEDEHTRNLLETVALNIETEYQSLLYHKDHALRQRKNELKNMTGLALTLVDGYYQDYRSGKLSEAQAQRLALEELRRLRYEGGSGYFWVHTIDEPVVKTIMHATIPQIENTFPSDPLFYKALPSGQHVLLALNDATRRSGAGYLRYTWPKPTAGGVNQGQPKLSYVARTKHWNWVVGSGVYIDDIEAETAARKAAIIKEVQNTLSQVKIAQSGYLFIFDGNNNVIIHPSLANNNVGSLLNPGTGKPLFPELMKAAQTPDKPFEYIWDKPPEHKGEFRFKKIAYVKYFAPLDWYLGSSVYLDEIREPSRALSQKIILLSLLFCGLAIGLALVLSRYLTQPLLDLTEAARAIEEQGLENAAIPVSGTLETRRLGIILNRMISSLIETNSALKENEEKLKILFETAGDAILLIRDGRFVDCNQHCTAVLGLDKSAILGRSPAEISPPCQADGQSSETKASGLIEDALAGQPQFFEWRYLRSDATTFDSEISLNRVELPGKPHLLAVMRDISERKRLEQEKLNTELRLRQAQKMEAIGTLAGGIAHDFNNILTGIIGYGELAMDELNNPQEAQSHLSEMLTAAERARNLVRQILTFSRRVETEVAAVEPQLIVKEAMKLLRASIPSTIEIVLQIENAAGTVMADPSQLHQIVMNLCTNAYAAMPAGGTLTVAVEPYEIETEDFIHNLAAGPYVRMTVSDTGSGMDAETLQHIFEPFFTTKPKGEGTGLGLATVHGIVKSLKGDITVYSEAGRGTSFNIYLPRIDAPTSTPEVETVTPSLGQGQLILLVDDELPILGLGNHILSKLGYTVTATASPADALEIFRQDPARFSLVVTDYAMPHMNGAQLAGELLKIRADIPIVLTSGFSPDLSEKWLKDVGIRQFIQKPYNLKTFAAVIGAILKA